MTSSSGPAGNTLVKRVVVGIVFAPLLAWFFWRGGYPLYGFFVMLTALGQWELFRMFEHRFWHRVLGYVGGASIIGCAFFGFFSYIPGILIASLMGSCCIEIIAGDRKRLETIALSLFSTVYPALFVLFLARISGLRYVDDFPVGRYVLLYVVLVIWMFDSASYFVGRKFGKRPFFPGASPKKTVEGFFGGLAGVVVLSLVAGVMADDVYRYHIIALSLLTALAGQAGDLAESIIKRECEVKDSSNIIPGHGGILDRFDSLFFAGPVVYGYIVVIIGISGGHS